MIRSLRLLVLSLASALTAMPVLGDPVLDGIASGGVVRLAVRADVAPFSSRGEEAYTGYSVDLCRRVAAHLEQELDRPLEIEMVEVMAENRFEVLREGRADVLCEATTMTLGRPLAEDVEFSLMTFVTGGTFLYREDAGDQLSADDASRVGAIKGTTAADALAAATPDPERAEAGVRFDTYHDAVAALTDGEIDILMGDRLVLQDLLKTTPALQERFRVSSQYLSYEPYALAVPAGAREMRYHVDRTLSDLYRSGEIGKLVLRHFSIEDVPRDLATMYRLLALP